MIDETTSGYLRTAADYVHLNPARAGLVAEGEKLTSYAWSSDRPTSPRPGKRPAWLRVDRVFGEHGIEQDDRRGRREFERRLESQRCSELAAGVGVMRNGWRVGGEDFLDWLLAKWDGKAGEHHGGRERRETEMERARRLIASELARAGWGAEKLATERKGDAI
ncbi:MAG: hypothetical protein M3Q89_08030 [Verrucomicrobiota bacterium]|nr:hypothetical protein [Verrucomicrobiota bacterium]